MRVAIVLRPQYFDEDKRVFTLYLRLKFVSADLRDHSTIPPLRLLTAPRHRVNSVDSFFAEHLDAAGYARPL
jgi:hypothetical protein